MYTIIILEILHISGIVIQDIIDHTQEVHIDQAAIEVQDSDQVFRTIRLSLPVHILAPVFQPVEPIPVVQQDHQFRQEVVVQVIHLQDLHPVQDQVYLVEGDIKGI